MITANPLTIGNSFGYYTGIFSTAVTASVNPTATMAVLSVLGAIENASLYSPDSAFFNAVAQSLNSIPVVNAAASLPIANPVAAVFLTLVAAIMIILHSFAESKIISQATIDKLEKLSGWIGLTALSLMPLVTNEEVQKTSGASKNAGRIIMDKAADSVSSGTPWYTWVIAIAVLAAASIVYVLCYDCVDSVGTILAAIPVKGLNIIEQLIKAVIHAGMILIQLTFPALSFILSIIIAIIAVFLFGILKRLTFYYKEVYIRPVYHLLLKNKPVALIHKKCPGKIRKAYPGLTVAAPVFVFNGISKLPSRGVIWYIQHEGTSHLILTKPFKKPTEISVPELKERFPSMEFIDCKRFFQCKTSDKKFNIVISKICTGFIDNIGKHLGLDVISLNEKNEVSNAAAVN